MNQSVSDRILVGAGGEAREIAVLARPGDNPGLVWLGGYRSDMTGSKAEAVDAHAAERGLAVLRLDYSGHGASGGRFEDGTISRWLEEAQAAFEARTSGPQIVIGSSMGGWIALLLAEALCDTGRLAGLVLIAPAADMTHDLMWAGMDDDARETITRDGVLHVPNDYSDEPYPITLALIEDGKRHLFGDRLIETGCPVHILQGVEDTDVPWQHAAKLVTHLASDDVVLTLIKDGDHRLSRPQDLARLTRALDDMAAEIRSWRTIGNG